MTQGPLYARVSTRALMGTQLLLNGIGDVNLVAGEITAARNGYGGGWAEFPLQTGLAAFLAQGRVVSLRYYDPVNPDHVINMGAFVIQGWEEDPAANTVRVYGPDLAEELAKQRVWVPIGEETVFATTVAEAIPAPWSTTALVGAPRNNDSISPVSVEGVIATDEVRVTMNGAAGVHVTTVRDVVFFDGRWRLILWDRFPENADAGNAIEYRRRKILVQPDTAGNFTPGSRVTLTMNTGTLTCLIDKDPKEDYIYLDTGVTVATNVGKAITATDWDEVATDDVTQIMAASTGGWSVEFETGTGTANGTSHPPVGTSVLDLLNTTAARSGEFWRLAAPLSTGEPRLVIKWRRTPDRAMVTGGTDNVLFQASTGAAQWGSNLYAVVDDAGYKQETVPYTRVYPIPGDNRVTLGHCTDAAIAAAVTRGYEVVTDFADLGLWGIPFVRRIGDTEDWGSVEPFNSIQAESNRIAQLEAAADQMLIECMDWLDAHPLGYRQYFDVTGYVRERYSPGSMFDIQFQGLVTYINRTSDADALVINRVTYSVGPSTSGLMRAHIEVHERKQGAGLPATGLVLPAPTAERLARVSDIQAKDALIKASTGAASNMRVTLGGRTPVDEDETHSHDGLVSDGTYEAHLVSGTSHVYPRVFNGVREYGMSTTAAGNVNRAALQEAVDDAAAAGGGAVYIPTGQYTIDTGINLGTNVHIVGDDFTRSVLNKTGADTTPLLNFVATAGNNVSGVRIERIKLTNSTAATSLINLEAETGDEVLNCTIRDVYCYNPVDAQAARCLTIKRQPRNVHVENCVFEGCAAPTTNLSRMTGQYTVAFIADDARNEPENTIYLHNCKIIGGQIGLNMTSDSNPPGVTAALDMRGCEFTGQTVIGARLYHGQSYKVIGNHWHDMTCAPTAAWLTDVTAKTGAAVTGTLNSTQATTNITGAVEDYYVGWELRVTSGARSGERSVITDFNVTNGKLTFSPALTGAMANGNTFTLIPTWCGVPAALWADSIFTSGSADIYRGSVLTIGHNLFDHIVGNAIFLEEPQNTQIVNNSISFIEKRTSSTISSIDPTGYTDDGGVGIFVSGGRGQPLLAGNEIHYCEHAAVRINANFVSIPEGPSDIQLVGNQMYKCVEYGVRIDGHHNTSIALTANTIAGDDDVGATPESGIYVYRAGTDTVNEPTTHGIARLHLSQNLINGFDYGVRKTYERSDASGMDLRMVGNDVDATGTYGLFWEYAAGAILGNNFRTTSTKVTSSGGLYRSELIVLGNGANTPDVWTANDVKWLQATILETVAGQLTVRSAGQLVLDSVTGEIITASGGDMMVSGGLTLGSNSVNPDAGQLWFRGTYTRKLYTGGTNETSLLFHNGTTAIDLTAAAAGYTAGNGLGLSGTTFSLDTPTAVTASSTNVVNANDHTHAVTASSNPGAAASLLKSDASGYLQVEGIGVGVTPNAGGHIRASGDLRAGSGLAAGDVTLDPGPGQLLLDKATASGLAMRVESDCGHGLTGEASSTDAYFEVSEEATGGSAKVAGFGGAVGQGLILQGICGNTSTTRTGTGPVTVYGYKGSGTARADADADQNVFVVRTQRSSANRSLFVVDAEGDLHVDGSGSLATFDEYDDVALLRAADLSLAGQIDAQFAEVLGYDREAVEAAGLVAFEDDGPMVNLTRMNRLLTGAVWQLSQRLAALEGKAG